jgi:signal transduction histidine kinase
VGQALTAVKLQLSRVGRTVGPEHRPTVDEARSVVDSALQSARTLSRLLHPPMLDDIGLAAAVDWYLKGFAQRTGLEVSFEHAGMDQRAAREIETCLYRVVQETTTNVARHAAARHCRVYLQRLPESLVLTVEDDGGGFDPGEPGWGERDGLGLLGIRERVAGFRGTFRLDSRPGAGTRVSVELPVLTAATAVEKGEG